MNKYKKLRGMEDIRKTFNIQYIQEKENNIEK